MLARHADSLFWLGRYIERAENTARLLDVTYHTQLEAMGFEASRAWRDLLRILRSDVRFSQFEQPLTAGTVSEFLVIGEGNPGAIAPTVEAARENARAVRELIPTELWEAVNTFHLDLRRRRLQQDIENQPHDLYVMIRTMCQAIAGAAQETMPRDERWHFFHLGRMLERALVTCRLVDVRFSQLVAGGAAGGFHHWMMTLRSASASEAFRRAYVASTESTDVIEFLLLAGGFPRSALFSVRGADLALARIEGTIEARNAPQRVVGRIRADLEFLDLHEMLRGDIHLFLDRLQTDLLRLCDEIGQEYFRTFEEPRAVRSVRLDGSVPGVTVGLSGAALRPVR